MQRRVAITTGDVDGIGLEVALKALRSIGPQSNICFLLFRSAKVEDSLIKPLFDQFNVQSATSLEDALSRHHDQSCLIDLRLKTTPALWVRDVARACMKNKISALATGPLSKTEIKSSGLKALGHTEILQSVSKAKSVHMGFKGREFNVVLMQGHVPLSNVPKGLTRARFFSALGACHYFLKSNKNKPIGFLGLNPHSGEDGLIGRDEIKLKVWAQEAARKGISLEGPLVPDVAFQKNNWHKFSTYLAMYHDQGLIPFKLVHGHSGGVHISLGLPFLRTSVDHGTAKDIFGQNRADSSSMEAAIRECVSEVMK